MKIGSLFLFFASNVVVDAFVVPSQLDSSIARSSRLFNDYLSSLSGPPSSNSSPSYSPPSYSPPPPPPPPPPPSAPNSPTGSSADSTDAIARLDASQAGIMGNIVSSIPDLASKPEFCYSGQETISGCSTKLDAFDAPGPSNIAWMSSLCVASKISSLTIFNGPLTDVPHLTSRCAILDGSIKFFLDFRPRSYGAYETVRPDGTYPGPEELGRQAFEYSGARKQFETNFGTPEVSGFLSSLSFESAVPNGVSSEFDTLTRGPLAIDVSMPATELNLNTILMAREKAAAIWLNWVLDGSHGHRPGAPVNTQYVYDSKYKQNAYSALLPIYSDWFGPTDGPKLAAADSGPLDEGYVGGGS